MADDYNAFLDSVASGNLDSLIGYKPKTAVPVAPAPEESGFLRRTVGDTAVSALKGAIAVPEAIVGLADIPTGGVIGRGLEKAGFRPKEAKATLDTLYSPEQQRINEGLETTRGFIPSASYMLQNPSTIYHGVVESAAPMLAGGVAARGIKAVSKLPSWAAGGVGEGVVGAGMAAEDVRQQTDDGYLTPGQSLSSLGSGAGTALFGVAGGKLANKYGFGDVETMIASGSREVTRAQKGAIRRIAEGAISEGAIEELPQSMQEQVWQNISLGRPALEGVPEAAAQGLLTGTVMGGGVNLLSKAPPSPAAPAPEQPQGTIRDMFSDEYTAPSVYEQAMQDAVQTTLYSDAQTEMFAPRSLGPDYSGYGATSSGRPGAVAIQRSATTGAPAPRGPVTMPEGSGLPQIPASRANIDPTTGAPRAPASTIPMEGLPPFAVTRDAAPAPAPKVTTPQQPSTRREKRADLVSTLDSHLAAGRITNDQYVELTNDVDMGVTLEKMKVRINAAIRENAPKDKNAPSDIVITKGDKVEVKKVAASPVKTNNRELRIAAGPATATGPAPERPAGNASDDERAEYRQNMANYLASGIDPVDMHLMVTKYSPDVPTSLRALKDYMGLKSPAAVRKRMLKVLSSVKGNAAAAGITWDEAMDILEISVDKQKPMTSADVVPVATDNRPDSFEFDETAGFERTETGGDTVVDEAEDLISVTEEEVSSDEVINDAAAQDAAEFAMNKYPTEAIELTASLYGNGFSELPNTVQLRYVAKVSDLTREHGHDVVLFEKKAKQELGVKDAKSKTESAAKVSEAKPESKAGSMEEGDVGDTEGVVIGKADVSKVKVAVRKSRRPKMMSSGKGKYTATGVRKDVAQNMVDRLIAGWKAAPVINVVEYDELAPDQRMWLTEHDETNARGFVTNGGQVFILVNNHSTIAEVKATLFHEVLGHVGLRAKYGAELTKLLKKVYDTNPAVRTLTDQYADTHGVSTIVAVEEVLSEAQANGKIPMSVWERLAAFIRSFARRYLKWDLAVSNTDLKEILRAARVQVESGANTRAVGEMATNAGSDRVTTTYYSEQAMKRAERFLKKEGKYRTVSSVRTPEGTYEVTRVKLAPKLSLRAADAGLSPDTLKAASRIGSEKAVVDTVYAMKKAVGYMTYLHDLVRTVSKKMPSANTWYDGIMKRQETRLALERDAEKVAVMASSLSAKEAAAINVFIAESTEKQLWGYAPQWKTNAQVDKGMAVKWGALSEAQREVVDAVFKHGFDAINRKRELFRKIGVEDVFSQLGAINGPYAPLKRFGGFVVVAKSQKVLDAEAEVKERDTKVNREILESLKQDSAEYIVRTFDTPGQAQEEATKLEKDFVFTDSFASSNKLKADQVMSYQVLEKVMSAVKADPSLPPQVREEMESTVRAMYLSSLDDMNARQMSQKRKGRAGYDTDMIRAFLAGARADAAYTANVEHGAEINEAFYKMQEEESKAPSGHRVNQDEFNLIVEHYAESMKYEPTPVQDRVVGLTSAWQLSTSLGYHLANMSQGIMVTLPRLAAEGSYGGAFKHLMDGYKTVVKVMDGMSADLTRIENPDLRSALEHAANRGILDVGIEEDLGQFDQFKTGYVAIDGSSRYVGMALHKLRSLSRYVETINRVSSGVAAFNQAIEQGKTDEQAREYMIDVLQSTQGDFTRTGAPLLLKKLPKVMVQYRKYQFMMMAFYVKGFHQAFKGATPEERLIGKRMMAFKLTHTAVAAGALGLPMMNLVALAFGRDDDDPEDLEQWLRRNIGNEVLADLLLRGVSAVTPLDMSAKLDESKVFSIAPFTEFDFSSREGVAKTVAGVAGGPAMGQVGRMADGIGLMANGQWVKGIEKQLPKGIADSMSAFRMANEGYTIKNGDVIVKPEDLTTWTLALTGIGLPTAQTKKISEKYGLQYQVSVHFSDRQKEIRAKYVAAAKDRDSKEMASLRKQWLELQKQKREARREWFNNAPGELAVTPLSSLTKAPGEARKREMKGQRAAG